LSPLTIEKYLEGYGGAKRVRYENALDSMWKKDIQSGIEIFVKDEPYIKEGSEPRCIFARNTSFNLIYGLFTKPLEELLMKHHEVTKSKNHTESGKLFGEKFMDNKYYYENDYSKFESCQRVEILIQIEFFIFLEMYPTQYHETIRRIFVQKLEKKCYSREGLNVYFEGCRGSGDSDTSLGNTLVNLCAIYYNFMRNGVKGTCMVDGDDSIIFSKYPIKNYFGELGLETKWQRRSYSWEIDYCSGRFLKISGNEFYYFRNPQKLLAGLRCYKESTRYNHNSYYYTLGVMMEKMYGNAFFYGKVGEFLRKFRAMKNTNYVCEIEEKLLERGKCMSTIERTIDNDIFETQFYMAFGYLEFEPKILYHVDSLKNRRMNREPRHIPKYRPEHEWLALRI